MPRIDFADSEFAIDADANAGAQTNLAVQAIISHRPEVAEALGVFSHAARSTARSRPASPSSCVCASRSTTSAAAAWRCGTSARWTTG